MAAGTGLPSMPSGAPEMAAMEEALISTNPQAAAQASLPDFHPAFEYDIFGRCLVFPPAAEYAGKCWHWRSECSQQDPWLC